MGVRHEGRLTTPGAELQGALFGRFIVARRVADQRFEIEYRSDALL
jgi:hypothetical protein